MKHLLIATDFSPASERAVDYGVHLAAALGAAITVVSAYEEIPVPVADTMSMTFIDTAAARDIVRQGLWRLQQRYQKDNVQLETLAIKGAIVPSILNAAAGLNADLIILGMKGKGRSIRKLLGSTATTLAQKTPIPLLVVPQAAGFRPPTNSLFSSDLRPDTNIHVLDPLRQLVHAYHSKLYVLRIIQKGAQEFFEVIHNQAPLRVLDSTWDVKYEYKIGEYVVDSINEFARTEDIQMLVMIPHPHSFPERWLMGSHTKEMLFESTIPLLLLPERA